MNVLYAVLVALTVFSCQDFDKMNENPNKVQQTHPRTLFTTATVDIFKNINRNIMYANRMVVQTDGENSEQYYLWQRGRFDAFNNLRNVVKMQEEAKRVKDKKYEAIAKFYRAYHFYYLTLTFGDIPYSQALKGADKKPITKPAYDKQKAVFEGILKELDEATTLIGSLNNIGGDIIYAGNLSKWKKLINSFKLKVLMTLSKKDKEMGIPARFKKVYDAGNLMTSNEDSGQITYLNQSDSRYPNFTNSSFDSGFYMSKTFVDLLKGLQDPRLFVFAVPTKRAKDAGKPVNDFTAYAGGDPIKPYNDTNLLAASGLVSVVNKRYVEDATLEPHAILSYSELQFILAEAALRGWITTGDAKTFYNNGIKANFAFYEKYGKKHDSNSTGYKAYFSTAKADTYIAQSSVKLDATGLSDDEKIKRVLTQRYIRTFFQHPQDAYFDHLRTGYPAFSHKSEEAPPYRWMYPEGEYNNNKENVKKAVTSQYGGKDETRQKPWWLK